MYKETIRNPVTGETLNVLESTKDVFRIEFLIEPGAKIAAEHAHPYQEQTIYVTKGALGCRINGLSRMLSVGEYAIIPAGVAHFQWNPTDQEARAIEELRPAGQAHNFFRVAFALARDGRTNAKGIPKPLFGAALVAELGDFIFPTARWLRFLFSVLGPLSKALGYRRIIRDYIDRLERDVLETTPVISFADTSAAKYLTNAGRENAGS